MPMLREMAETDWHLLRTERDRGLLEMLCETKTLIVGPVNPPSSACVHTTCSLRPSCSYLSEHGNRAPCCENLRGGARDPPVTPKCPRTSSYLPLPEFLFPFCCLPLQPLLFPLALTFGAGGLGWPEDVARSAGVQRPCDRGRVLACWCRLGDLERARRSSQQVLCNLGNRCVRDSNELKPVLNAMLLVRKRGPQRRFDLH